MDYLKRIPRPVMIIVYIVAAILIFSALSALGLDAPISFSLKVAPPC